ncbi:MAG: BBP7 family outer membrane beta-barrel protein [Planctomycetota bacterium]
MTAHADAALNLKRWSWQLATCWSLATGLVLLPSVDVAAQSRSRTSGAPAARYPSGPTPASRLARAAQDAATNPAADDGQAPSDGKQAGDGPAAPSGEAGQEDQPSMEAPDNPGADQPGVDDASPPGVNGPANKKHSNHNHSMKSGPGSDALEVPLDEPPVPRMRALRQPRMRGVPLNSSRPMVTEIPATIPGDGETWLNEGESGWDGIDMPVGRATNRWFVDTEYLIWWRKGQTAPPLVTTAPTTTSSSDAGVLGLPGTTVLYGPEAVGGQAQAGGRLSFGRWLDDCQDRAVGVRAFFLGRGDATFRASNTDFPVLARPFLDVTPGLPADQNALLVAYPGDFTGNIQVTSQSDVLGGDVYLRQMFHQSELSRVDFVMGYQFSRVDQSLEITNQSNDGSATLSVRDFFSTKNEFHGGSLGFMFNFERRRWHLDVLAKVGLGSMHESVTIAGQQSPNGGQGGLLARVPSNVGTFTRNEFAAVPEVSLTWSWRIRGNWEMSLGYSFLYWSTMMPTSGVIDPQLAVNLSDPFTGALRPNFAFRTQEYWVQGASIGLSCKF